MVREDAKRENWREGKDREEEEWREREGAKRENWRGSEDREEGELEGEGRLGERNNFFLGGRDFTEKKSIKYYNYYCVFWLIRKNSLKTTVLFRTSISCFIILV